MNRRRWIIGILVFIFIGGAVYAFANTGGNQDLQEPNTTENGSNTGTETDGNTGTTPDNDTEQDTTGEELVVEPGNQGGTGTGTGTGGYYEEYDEVVRWERNERYIGWEPEVYGAVIFNALRQNDTGTVTITKRISNETNPNEVFTFVITGKTAKNVDFTKVVKVNPSTNETVEIDGIPYGSYTVKECSNYVEGQMTDINDCIDHKYYSFGSFTEEGAIGAGIEGQNEFNFVLTKRSPSISLIATNNSMPTELDKVVTKINGLTPRENQKVYPGDVITYKVTYTNNGDKVIKNPILEDTLVTNLTSPTIISVTIDGDAAVKNVDYKHMITLSSNILKLSLKEFAEEVVVEYTAKVTATAAQDTIIKNVVTASGDNTDETLTDEETNPVENTAVINVTKVSNIDKVKPGETVIYTITVENLTSGVIAKNVKVTDALPDGLINISDLSEGMSISNNIITVNIDELAYGEENAKTYTFKAVVAESAKEGTITNPVEAKGDNTDTDKDSDDIEVIKNPILEIVKTAETTYEEDKTLVRPGDEITYTLVVTNKGEGTAYDVEITDKVPAGTEFVKYLEGNGTKDNAGNITWTIGTVGSSDTVTVKFVVKVKDLAKDTLIENIGYVTGEDGFDEKYDDKSEEVEHTVIAPEIDITKTSSKPATEILYEGTEYSYTITVTNKGNDKKTNLIIEDTLVSGIDFKEFIDNTNNANVNCKAPNAQRKIICDIKTVDAGKDIRIKFTVAINDKAIVGKAIENDATVKENAEDEGVTTPKVYNNVGTKVKVSKITTATTDVVLVFDRSSSMNNDNKMANAKAAAIEFINTLIPNDSSEYIRVSLVAYGTTITDTITLMGTKAGIIAKINAIPENQTGNGTNTQLALETAYGIINQSVADNKFVVLLSDGVPTYYIGADGNRYGNGNSDIVDPNLPRCANATTGTRPLVYDSVTKVYTCYDYKADNQTPITSSVKYTCTSLSGNCRTNAISSDFKPSGRAKIEADKIKGVATLYTIGFGVSAGSDAQTVLNGLATSPSHAYNAANKSQLTAYFETIANSIKKTLPPVETDVEGVATILDIELKDQALDNAGQNVPVITFEDGTYKWNVYDPTKSFDQETGDYVYDEDEDMRLDDENYAKKPIDVNYNEDANKITWDVSGYETGADLSVTVVVDKIEETPEEGGTE